MSHGEALELAAVIQSPASVATAPSVPRLAFTSERENRSISADQVPLLSQESLDSSSDAIIILSRSQSSFVILSVTAITTVSSLLAGVITVAIPRIAEDIALDHSLLLWPASIYALVAGCTLLLSGSATDILGSRFMYLSGTFLQCTFVLACGLARTGSEIIAFRALSGLANSMCLPSAVSIITNSFATGKRRNFAFAAMGGGQPTGFAIGLTLGGVLTDTIGWRWAFYLAAIFTAIVGAVAAFTIPKDEQDKAAISWEKLRKNIDWVGACLASLALAGLSYTFASVTTSVDRITQPLTASILGVSLLLLPVFSLWMERQTRRSLPALIPNQLWTTKIFTCVCLGNLLVWASFNSLEQLLSFYFQYVQRTTALTAALRFLPFALVGLAVNVITAYLVPRVRADVLVGGASLISLAAPLLMVFATPTSSYWAFAFPGMLISPCGIDTFFTVSNLVITGIFAKKDQGLAGGVFQTVAQIGKSFGLAIAAVIANSVTMKEAKGTSSHGAVDAAGYTPLQLMVGYRAAFWFCFALNAAMIPVVVWGLRKVGKVGEKRD